MAEAFDNQPLGDKDDRADRRLHNRRATDIVEVDDLKVSDFRLSLKEVGFILTVLFTIATTLFNFHSQLEKTNSENQLKYELMNTKLTSLQDNVTRIEKSNEQLKAQLEDIERLAGQIYQRTKDKQ